jgi:CheY-like chemotaxis protein
VRRAGNHADFAARKKDREMASTPAHVLDVGNCDHDHSLIREMLAAHFSVSIDRAATVGEAIEQLRGGRYSLVLVNRIIDRDGGEGIELVQRVKADESLRAVPIMMVSNFAEAQEACVAAGGERGFGKAALTQASTIDLLARCLPRK